MASLIDSGTGLTIESHSYDPVHASPMADYRFGWLQQSYSYNYQGLLSESRDALNRATTYTNYMRGIPQNVGYPDGTAESAVVNNLGNILSHTNAVGTTTTFGYDAMGRLSSVTPPSGDTSSYFATTRTYEQVGFSEYGLPAGHWRQTINKGNSRTVLYFDALWRLRLSRIYDASNEANTRSMTAYKYDADNRKTFESYPVRSINSVDDALNGRAWAFDALGREIGEYQDSELGLLTATTEYLTSFQRRDTNFRGYSDTFTFQAFDTPDESAVVNVASPEGTNVAISRDNFGKPRSITRSGTYMGSPVSVVRSYVYDSHQRLCKMLDPETGATVQEFDGAGYLAWRAAGLALPSTTSCDQSSVPGTAKTNYTYNFRGQPTAVSFGDGSAGISRSYTSDGLPYQVSSGLSTWTYSYNNLRVLKAESATFGSSTSVFNWGIDSYGNMSSIQYPDGVTLTYAPNALGQPTQVSGYLSSITYHPNGAIQSFNRANGVPHSATQNVRGLPLQISDAGVIQDLYSYDANRNVTGITDQQQGVTNRSMYYDGLDRLTQANGSWGVASFGYDSIDNLRSSTVGSRSTSTTYDGSNRPINLVINGTSFGIGYDAHGNVVQRGGQAFNFDAGNRLRSVSGIASYDYDGLGARIRIVYANGQERVQLYGKSGRLLYGWHSTEGATKEIYLGSMLVAEVGATTGTRFTHGDALRSLVATTNTSGGVISRTRYEPYGATHSGDIPTSVGFTGHINDGNSGLVYMLQRYYDPVAGRFMSTDPILPTPDGASFNRYAYVSNNPYSKIDPFGLAEMPLGSAHRNDAIYQAGKIFDSSRFDIIAHGVIGQGVVGDSRGRTDTAAVPIPTGADLIEMAVDKFGYKLGTPILLSACDIDVNYAIQVAIASKATVMFSTLPVEHYISKDMKTAVLTPHEIDSSTPAGWHSVSITGDTITITVSQTDMNGNTKTSTVSTKLKSKWAEAETGSRIRTRSSQ